MAVDVLLGQRLIARDFDRQVAEVKVRITVMNGYPALGKTVTVPSGEGGSLAISQFEHRALLIPYRHADGPLEFLEEISGAKASTIQTKICQTALAQKKRWPPALNADGLGRS